MHRIHRLLSKYDYAQVQVGRNSYSRVLLKDREVDTARQGGGETVACRVYIDGAMGFASGNNPDELTQLLSRAEKLAKAKPGQIKLAEPEKHMADSTISAKLDAREESLEAKIERLKEWEKLARRPNIHRVELVYSDAFFQSRIYTSNGSEIFTQEPRIVCQAHVYSKKGARMEAAFDQVKSRAGLEALSVMPEKVESAVSQALLMLTAGKGPSGKINAVLDPELAGVLSHEAVGHACEADEVQIGGSCLQGKLGKTIANASVNISDSGAIDPLLWGSFAFDHEGTVSKYTPLVKNGVLSNYLTSLQTAFENGGRLSGNARGQWGERPIVRMSNTFFEAGDAQREELFEEVKNGVYLVGCKEGQVSPKTGNFTFAARYGYVVKNGETTRLFKDGSINGNILENLKRVTLVGKDLEFTPGTCGKDGQDMPVTTGSPHLAIGKILVG